MTSRPPPQGVPTLTEVIALGTPLPDAESAAPPQVAPEKPLPSADSLTVSVLADVQRQVDLMLEHRLREALMPALLRATDALILEVRTELASALQALVARAVEQALARHREP